MVITNLNKEFFSIFISVALILVVSGCVKKNCRRGHLVVNSSCEVESSSINIFDFGWESHLAKGKIDPSYCETIRKTTELGTFQGFGSVTTSFKKVSCEPYLASFNGMCIFGQKKEDIAFLAIDTNCESGIFFNGRKRTLLLGKIVPLQ